MIFVNSVLKYNLDTAQTLDFISICCVYKYLTRGLSTEKQKMDYVGAIFGTTKIKESYTFFSHVHCSLSISI